jgi:YjbE family integral membrane protein
MGFDGVMHALGMMLQVFLLDLVLSGDNAVVIALACRSLPPRQMRQAILIGTGAAIFLRVLLTTVITFLLAIPSLRLIGGLALIYIALKLMLEEEDAAEGAPGAASDKLWSTVWIVVVADLVMSLDNVVALAAAVHGSIFFLVAGLLLSVPLLMFGSMFVSGLLNRFPLLVPAVGALLGWIAGDIGVSDPLVADWVNSQSPALIVAMPMLCAAYVLLQSKILKERRARTGAVSGAARKAPLSMRILSMNAAAAAIAQPDSGPAREASAAPAEIMPPRPAAAPPRTPLRPRPRQFAGLPPLSRRGVILTTGAAAALLILLFFSYFGKSLMPAPAHLPGYDCPGFRGAFYLYYQAGTAQVQLRSGAHVVDGVMHAGRIEWDGGAGAALGFAPPDEIKAGDAGSIQINGGNFVRIACAPKP